MKAPLKYLLLALVTMLISFGRANADSPLTSTPFADAYKTAGVVKAATKANGVITAKLMKYLSNPGKPLDLKMALINQLGWNIDGRTNGRMYKHYVEKNKGITLDNAENWNKVHPHELLSMAYLIALDNYFDVKAAAEMARAAAKRLPKSYTAQIVSAMICAQEAFDTNWCQVYQLTDAVRQNTSLTQDMRPEAIKIIFDYMDIYSGEC
ncbi:MAG: hypothetical protein U0176_08200 [Bacteroidia bacterium]